MHDIKIIHARDKFFIVMPSRKNPDDTYRDIVHPIHSQFRAMLEDAVIAAYERELAAEAAREAEEQDLARQAITADIVQPAPELHV